MSKASGGKDLVDHTSDGAKDCLLPSLEIARSILAHTLDPIMLGDAETHQLAYANPAAEKMLGRSSSEILQMKIFDIHPEEAVSLALDQFTKMAKGELSLVSDIPLLHSNGTVTYYDIRGCPVEVAGKKYLLGNFRDVTQRRAAQEEMQALEERFKLAIEALPMGLYLYHLEDDNRLIFSGYNPAADRIIGVDNSLFIGKTLEEAFPPLADTPIPEAYLKVARDGGVWHDDQVVYEHEEITGAYEVVAFQLKPGDVGVMFWDVTERKKAEESQRSERSRLAEILEGTNAGTWDWNVQTGEASFNERWAGIMGRTLEELEPTDINTWIDNVYPEDLRVAQAELDKHFARETDYYDVLFRQPHKQGGWVWVNARGKVVEWTEDGKPLRMRGTHLDITERKNAMEALRFKNLVFDESIAANSIADPDGIITEVNDMFLRMWGYLNKSEVIGKPIPAFLNIPAEAVAITNGLNEKGQWEGDYIAKRKDGSTFTAHGMATTVRDESGEMIGYQAAVVDITERVKAEEEMRRLMAAMNGMQESVVITNPKGLILYANPCFERLTGYTLDEVKGQPIGMYKSGKHDKDFYDRMWEVLKKGETWTGNFINKRKDGSLFEEYASISPVHNEEGKLVHFVAVKRDMTRERDLERRMVRSQKMAALGQFAHRIAHDVTNHLTMIMGSSELLARSSQSANGKELSEGIVAAVEHIAGLTSELMGFADPGKMSMKVVSLDRILKGMGEMISRVGGPAVNVEIDVRDKCRVNIDETQMEQVIMHLVVNACEAMGGPGTINISICKGVMTPQESIGVDDFETKEIPAAVLEVKDDGVGLKIEDCSKAFEPFFTTKKDLRRHAGLGLATVYGIVARHDGDVALESLRGTGTTVKIYLPLVD